MHRERRPSCGNRKEIAGGRQVRFRHDGAVGCHARRSTMDRVEIWICRQHNASAGETVRSDPVVGVEKEKPLVSSERNTGVASARLPSVCLRDYSNTRIEFCESRATRSVSSPDPSFTITASQREHVCRNSESIVSPIVSAALNAGNNYGKIHPDLASLVEEGPYITRHARSRLAVPAVRHERWRASAPGKASTLRSSGPSKVLSSPSRRGGECTRS